MAWQEASEATDRAAKDPTRPVGCGWKQKALGWPNIADHSLAPLTGSPTGFFKRQITVSRLRALYPKIGANRISLLMIAENLGARSPLMAADNTPRKQQWERH